MVISVALYSVSRTASSYFLLQGNPNMDIYVMSESRLLLMHCDNILQAILATLIYSYATWLGESGMSHTFSVACLCWCDVSSNIWFIHPYPKTVFPRGGISGNSLSDCSRLMY